MFLQRSANQVIQTAIEAIAANSLITNFQAGSIARSIVEAIAPEIGSGSDEKRSSLYQIAQTVLDQGFISKATGNSLDLIGAMLSYPRRKEQVKNELGVMEESLITDDAYRYELTQVVPSMGTANEQAIRLALLLVPGVSDVIGKEYSHGTGSFSYLVILNVGEKESEMLPKLETALQSVKAFGIRPAIQFPVSVPVDLAVQLIFHESTSATQQAAIRAETQVALIDYLAKRKLGEGIIYNDLVQEIMNSHAKILDFELLKFSLNNEPVLFTNQTIYKEEQLQPQTIQVY